MGCTITALIAEFEQWIEREDLGNVAASADEMLCDFWTEHERTGSEIARQRMEWLKNFCDRWEIAEAEEARR